MKRPGLFRIIILPTMNGFATFCLAVGGILLILTLIYDALTK